MGKSRRLLPFVISAAVVGCAAGPTPEVDVAAKNGDVKTLNTLLDRGASTASTDQYGYTPLHWAVFSVQLDAAKLLISRGAAIDVQDAEGDTPLMIGCNVDRDDPLVSLLLEHGASTTVVDRKGYTALCFAAENGYFAGVQALLEHGADPNFRPRPEFKKSIGRTAESRYRFVGPLELARDSEHDQIVSLLKEHGARE